MKDFIKNIFKEKEQIILEKYEGQSAYSLYYKCEMCGNVHIIERKSTQDKYDEIIEEYMKFHRNATWLWNELSSQSEQEILSFGRIEYGKYDCKKCEIKTIHKKVGLKIK